MINQLDIFPISPDCSSRDLPSAKILLEPKVEEALKVLEEVAELAIKHELVEGCIVRSQTAFKGKTAKFLRFTNIAGLEFAVVELEFRGCLIEYTCTVRTLEVVT